MDMVRERELNVPIFQPHYRGSRRLFKHRSAQAERTHGRRTLSVRFVGGK